MKNKEAIVITGNIFSIRSLGLKDKTTKNEVNYWFPKENEIYITPYCNCVLIQTHSYKDFLYRLMGSFLIIGTTHITTILLIEYSAFSYILSKYIYI